MTESIAGRKSRRVGGFWNNRTDEELVNYDFTQSDPSRLDNLLDEVPPHDGETPDVEFTYDTLVTGTGMVRCIHCKRHAVNHNRGFVLRFSDGRRMLFGRDCGAKVYGHEFVAGRNQFDAMMKRAELLKRKRHVFENRRVLADLFEVIEVDRAWSEYEDMHFDFVRMFPETFSRIARAIRYSDGLLSATERVRDHDREQTHFLRTGKKKSFYKDVTLPIYRLRGGAFFYSDTPLRSREIADLCKRARSSVWNFGDVPHKDIHPSLRHLDNIVERLDDAAARFASMQLAISSDNIAGLGRWLTRTSSADGGMRLEPGRLVRVNTNGEIKLVRPSGSREYYPAIMPIPDPFPSPPSAAILELQRILLWRP